MLHTRLSPQAKGELCALESPCLLPEGRSSSGLAAASTHRPHVRLAHYCRAGGSAHEFVRVSGFDSYELTNSSSVVVSQVGSETQFRALDVAGSGQDNPISTDLTEWQQSLSVRLLFSNISSFEYAACFGAQPLD